MTLYSTPESSSQSPSPVLSKQSLPNYIRTSSLKQNKGSTCCLFARCENYALVGGGPLHNVQQWRTSTWGLSSPYPLQRLSFFTSRPSWLIQLCRCCLRLCFAFPTPEFYFIMVSVLTNHKLKTFVKDAIQSCRDSSPVSQFCAGGKPPVISQ